MRNRLLLATVLLLAGCSLTALGQRALERKAGRLGFVERVATDGDRVLRWWAGGDGTPLMLLHGFGGDGLNTWRAQLDAFAERRRVLVPDLLWFGGSRGGGPPTLEAQARAMLAVMDHEGIDRVDLVGISYGGFVTMKLLQIAPERVDQVVIVDSPGPVFTPADEAAMLARFGATSAEDVFLPDDPADVKVLLDLTMYKDVKIPGFILQDLLVNVFSANREEQRALLRDLQDQRGTVALPDLSAHPAPLLVWGRYDEVFPVETGSRLAAALGARLEVIDETAHGPPVERPDTFNRIVLDYLTP